MHPTVPSKINYFLWAFLFVWLGWLFCLFRLLVLFVCLFVCSFCLLVGWLVLFVHLFVLFVFNFIVDTVYMLHSNTSICSLTSVKTDIGCSVIILC